MDMAMSNGHDVVEEVPVDGASVASSEDYNNAPPSPSSLADEQGMTANGMLASTRPKEQTDRFGFTGGKQFTKDSDWNTPVQVIRRREIKWLDMLDDWDKWMSKKPKKVRERCRKGIPCSIRPRAWQYLCGSKKLYEQNKARWQEMDSSEGDPKWLEVIQKDLDRQFPFHEMFANRDGHGQQDLFRILKAYSIYNPRDGYCQAQAPVAAVLLMHMPAEDAFWALVQICEKYLTGYYSVGLEAVQIDGMVLAGLMKKESPTTHKHMKKHKIDPILYMTEWFMCMFSRTLPWPSVLRVWDMFFCEGVKVLFRVALVLLKSTLGRSEQLRDCQGLYETMEVLRNIPASITHEDFLAAEMLKLRVFEKDMEAEHCLSLARRKVIKERQLAPEKAAAMQRDIDQLRKKKRGKVKPPPNRDHREGFGSSDLLAQEKAAEQSASAQRPNEPMGAWNEHHQVLERTARAQSPLSDPAGGRPEMVREVHVDNPPKDWNRSTAESPVSPGPEKSTKSKDSKKEEKKKEKVEKKKGKFHSKTEVMSIPSPETVLGEEVDGTTEQKDDKDWHRGTGESPGSPGIEQPPKSKDSKKQEKKKEKVEKKKGKSHSKTEVMSIPSPETVLGEEVDETTEQNDDKDWHRGTGESPGSPGIEQPPKSKDSKKQEKKKEKVEKKKGKSHSKTEVMSIPSPGTVWGEEADGTTEQKDDKDWHRGTGESPGSPGIEQPPKSKDSKKQEKKKEKVEKKKGKSHSKTEVMGIPSPGTVLGEEADGTTEQKDWHRGTGESLGSPDTEKPPKSKDSKEEKKKEKVEKKGKSHSKTELMNTPSPEPVFAEEEAGNTEQKDKKSKNKGKKAKKAEKGGKKNKEKASHSSSQPSSPLGSPDQEEPRRLSNGNDHAVKETVRSDNVTEALPEQITEYRLSPYAAVFHPETEPVPVVTGTNNTEVLAGIPTRSPAEEQQTSPSSRQASLHQDHHDDQSPQHFGMETPV